MKTSRTMRILTPVYAFAAVVLLYAFALFAPNAVTAAAVCLVPAFAVGVVCVYSSVKKKLSTGKMMFLILALALAVRVYYIVITPWHLRQHDLYRVIDNGHTGYIYRIFTDMSLPDSNEGLFYHPPLHHFLCAVFARICEPFFSNTDELLEILQILTAYWSLMCSWVFLRILETLKVGKSTALLLFAFFALHPTNIILSGSINNDMLCYLLTACAILYMLRWNEEQSLKNGIVMGIFLGCAMMTKLSAVLTAPVIACLFIYRLIKPSDTRKKTLASELSFAAVSIPLGMWYPVRNLLRFSQPFGYVMRIGNDHPLYCGDHSLLSRFLPEISAQTLSSPYCDAFTDYNVPVYALKCSCFGEFSFSFPEWSAWVLVGLQAVLWLMSLYAAVRLIIKKKNLCACLSLTAVCVINIISYVIFNISYPHGCSMDCRYLLPCLVCGSALTAMLLDGSGKRAKMLLSVPLCLFTAFSFVLFMSTGVI